MKIYVDWENNAVMSQKDYDEWIAKGAEEIGNDELSRYLESYYDFEEVFSFTKAQKEKVYGEYMEHVKDLFLEESSIDCYEVDPKTEAVKWFG